MASAKHFLLFLICVFLFLASVSATIPKGITLKLIHRDSINFSSSNNQPSNMSLDLSSQAFGGSMSHLDEIVTGCGAPVARPCPKDIQANLWSKPRRSVLFVEFFIKDSSYQILAVMDTGSSLTWVHCIPCTRCPEAGSRIFDPLTSSTFTNVSFGSPYCKALSNPLRSELGTCWYGIEYMGAPPSVGYLSRESFIFATSDSGLVTIPDVVFGCSHISAEHPDSIMGIVGLNAKITSFATQFGSKFSYCVGNINDRAYAYNQLSFGDAAAFEGDTTPMDVEPSNGCYYVNLDGISLGGNMIDLPSETFRKINSTHGGVMIDSGNEITLLPEAVHEILADKIRRTSSLPSYFSTNNHIRRLCLEGNMSTEMEGFPELRFHFPGGAELAMDPDGLFVQTETSVFCMTLVTMNTDPPKIHFFTLGINAQQHYNIGIDPSEKKLYIQRIECELLLD